MYIDDEEFEKIELVDGTVRIPVDFTVKQFKYLKDLGEDLRSNFSAAVACCVNPSIEAHEKAPMDILSYKMRKAFDHLMMCCNWKDGYKLLEEFKLKLEAQEIKEKLKDVK